MAKRRFSGLIFHAAAISVLATLMLPGHWALAAPATAPPAPALPATAPPQLAAQTPLPEVFVTRLGTEITTSCRVRFAPGLVLTSTDVPAIIIKTAGITLEFAQDHPLVGSRDDVPHQFITGIGILITDAANVTLTDPHIRGYRIGIHAVRSPGLSISGAKLAGMYRPLLQSTREREDQADWLWPHNNDAGQWAAMYGAAICVDDSPRSRITGATVRESQNGILLSRSDGSSIAGNDCSFLSGWGLALWRTSNCAIVRNAFDFCIRGYSHGIYNRGQDSAGILLFEQCSGNIIAQNSATHCGDGLFIFAGKQALGETLTPLASHVSIGCNNNLIAGNDFSYAAAHGIELTFSFDNRIVGNRLVGNAICGIWAGYSQRTIIDGNTIEACGQPAQREGGGINIEHGVANLITANNFARNTQAIVLWADANAALASLPWAKANAKGSIDNAIIDNHFDAEPKPITLRTTRASTLRGNTTTGDGAASGAAIIDQDEASTPLPPLPPLPNMQAGAPMAPHLMVPPVVPVVPVNVKELRTRFPSPVGKRRDLAGRQNIIMTADGPWDHASPLLLRVGSAGWQNRYELRKPADGTKLELLRPGNVQDDRVFASVTPPEQDGGAVKIDIRAGMAGLWPYELVATPAEGSPLRSRGTLLSSQWDVTFFPYLVDPTRDVSSWRAESSGARAVRTTLPRLSMRFGYTGPSGLRQDTELTAAKLPSDRFGLIASTVVPLSPGRYTVRTLSDDGIRIWATTGGGLAAAAEPGPVRTVVLENWTNHSPATDTGIITVPGERTPTAAAVPVLIELEYFQGNGYAVLEFSLEPEVPFAPEKP